jgi:S-adenosylmethionine:tRNA ribosyltransferase-isomerase
MYTKIQPGNPRDISIADFTYDLPPELIALHPLAERDASRLLICRSNSSNGPEPVHIEEPSILEDQYRNIADYLPPHSFLIFNNTRVVEARLLFHKPTGAVIELFCLEPAPGYGDIAAAMLQKGHVQWKCLIGGASKWKPGQVLVKSISYLQTSSSLASLSSNLPSSPLEACSLQLEASLAARFLGKLEDSFLIDLSWHPAGWTFAELLHHAGSIPLPPYIDRPAEESDSERYQTIYARHDGSVAAPTAGLHFTGSVFQRLASRQIAHGFVTLHVGAGTFLPVKAATLGQHPMHVEYISVTRSMVRQLTAALESGLPVIPVGTTSARTIESLYWLGLKVVRDPALPPADLSVGQWDPYDEATNKHAPSNRPTEKPAEVLTVLLQYMDRHGLDVLVTTTRLLITPGYEWKVAAGLITNFHQPKSTLLLLVASLIGEDWKKIYEYALEHRFRFLSYGDGCLLLPSPSS